MDIDALREFSKKIHTYGSILSLLHWDQETYMPSGALFPRSEQIALLSEMIHELKTGKKYRSLLGSFISLSSGKVKKKHVSSKDKILLREWHKEFLRAHKLPAAFVREFSQTTSEASQIWATAKKENNFKLFAPFLSKIIQLSRKKAELFGFQEHPYDALLESYEPCMTTRRVSGIFNALKKELVALLKKIRESKEISADFLHKKVDNETQMRMSHLLVSKLPLDPAYTRLDLSSHPFSIALHPHDSRITTRILPNAFMSNLFSVLHEAGHSLYEMGLPAAEFGTPLCEATSLSIHESQSRFWETIIGRSLPFWQFFYPLLKKECPALLKSVPLEKFYRAIHRVSPSLIRVEADEVTYCLHVILRFEIEKELISGTLRVDDLPEAWKIKMQELLGITPPNDTLGCLQDIHWSLGDFGYFPTYALGNLCAAQIFGAFSKQHPDWEKNIASGDFHGVRNWLKTEIHQWGKTYDTDALIKKATGKPFSEKAYVSYLNKKYSQIYKF